MDDLNLMVDKNFIVKILQQSFIGVDKTVQYSLKIMKRKI